MSCPSPGDLPDPGIEPGSPALQADSLPSETPRGSDTHDLITSQRPCLLIPLGLGFHHMNFEGTNIQSVTVTENTGVTFMIKTIV